ncbi:hypothetical protein [Aliiglaciecola aliphaticivorans]
MHSQYFETLAQGPAVNGKPCDKANCIVFELIEYRGKTERHQIGYAHSAIPLQAAIYADTLLGVFEIVNMDDADVLHKSISPKQPFTAIQADEEITFFEEEELTHEWH